jgi:hypothetical protein
MPAATTTDFFITLSYDDSIIIQARGVPVNNILAIYYDRYVTGR